jgi:ABC-type sugar transport system substrate-binding protein
MLNKRGCIAVAFSLGLFAAGCGSSSTTSTQAPASSSPTSGSTSSSASSITPAIMAQLQHDLTRPTSIGLTVPFTGKVPASKTIAYMECGVPSCAALAQPLQKALSALGWKLRAINTGATPESIKAAWDSLLQNKPDGVITIANPSTIFASEMAQLGAANIPVIQITTTDKVGKGGTAAAFADLDFYKSQGESLARYVLVNGGSKATVLLVETNAIPTVSIMQNTFGAYLKTHCPGCAVSILPVPLTSVGGDLSQRIISYVSAHPNVKWVYTAFVDMNAGLPAALNAAGLSGVKLVTFNTDATTDQYIRGGQNLVAAVTYPGAEIMYRCVDWLLRHFAGQPTAPSQNAPTPTWLVTKSNIPPNNDFTNVVTLDQQYRALWKVK